MVNYACAFSQSESEKYFEWIIRTINPCRFPTAHVFPAKNDGWKRPMQIIILWLFFSAVSRLSLGIQNLEIIWDWSRMTAKILVFTRHAARCWEVTGLIVLNSNLIRSMWKSLEASNLDRFWHRPSQTIRLWFSGGWWRGTSGSGRKWAKFRRRCGEAGRGICKHCLDVLLCISRGCPFQATENATKTQNTILKTYGKLS